MRKALGILILIIGLCGLLMTQNRSEGQAQANKKCSPIAPGCPECQIDGQGCWAWSGTGPYNCVTYQGLSCDPNQVEVTCTGIWYRFGSCTGINCYPNDCCRQGQLTAFTQQQKAKSCVP